MIKLEIQNYNMILIEKLQKYRLYHQVNLKSMNILHVKKYYLPIKNKKQNKLNLLIHLWEKPLKNKQKRLKIKEKNK